MKRQLILISGLFLCIACYAQKFQYGITSHIAINQPPKYRTHIGWAIGFIGEYNFNQNRIGNFYFTSKLKISEKGWKDDIYDIEEEKHTRTTHTYYLEIPISIGYKLIINTKSNIFFDFGPYLAYGLFGNYNIDYAELENDKNDLFTCGAYKRFDFGFQGNIGINITNFQIGIGAVQSKIKPTKDIWNLENPKEKSFLLNISYFFNR